MTKEKNTLKTKVGEIDLFSDWDLGSPELKRKSPEFRFESPEMDPDCQNSDDKMSPEICFTQGPIL